MNKQISILILTFILILTLVVFSVFFSGCATTKTGEEITTKPNSEVITKPNENVRAKPIVDYGEIEATILSIDEASETAMIKVTKTLQYTHDSRAEYPSLKIGDELNVKFQWGTKSTQIDLPPIGEGNEDINLPGIEEEDVIKGEINNEQGWRIYKYETL